MPFVNSSPFKSIRSVALTAIGPKPTHKHEHHDSQNSQTAEDQFVQTHGLTTS
ncbi:hypothetical protein MGWOODY_XGa2410 [hydrothermal vent metagenome]|uniref:Uncharacterized protein n=1 Tax=hydrothermal vent metagenome TaxID=652676 RepID=A0A160TS47_9ZZZZ